MTQEHSFFTEATVEPASRPSSLSVPSLAPFRLLLVLTTARSSSVVELEDGAERTVGRAAPADIVLQDPALSRLHARLRREGESVRIVDLGSRNGSWLGGRRVEEAVARAGGTFVLGSTTVTVQLAPPPLAANLGLVSTDSIVSRLEEECARARAFQRPLSLLILRGLHRGQPRAGALSQGCARLLRPSDRLGLYDRDAVIVVLPETPLAEAAALAERVLRSSGDGVPLVCGLAGSDGGHAHAEPLLQAALDALRQTDLARPLVQAGNEAQVRPATADTMLRISPAMLELQRVVERLARRPITVLLLGETGTGKELLARELHERSPRASQPLKVVNCAAIPEELIESVLFGHVRGAFTGAHRDQAGVFTQAHGGTIFLDEVGELSSAAQAALLRVLDTRRLCPVGGHREQSVDVRVVAATHRDLAALAEQGRFRLDLFHRLNSVVLRIPPLRERTDELVPLLEHFLSLGLPPGSHLPRISDGARAQLLAYAWPGNVRELRNVAERALALLDSDCIECRDLPLHIAAPDNEAVRVAAPAVTPQAPREDEVEVKGLRSLLKQREAAIIRAALAQCGGNQRRAAQRLDVPLRTLERKLRLLRIRATE